MYEGLSVFWRRLPSGEKDPSRWGGGAWEELKPTGEREEGIVLLSLPVSQTEREGKTKLLFFVFFVFLFFCYQLGVKSSPPLSPATSHVFIY